MLKNKNNASYNSSYMSVDRSSPIKYLMGQFIDGERNGIRAQSQN